MGVPPEGQQPASDVVLALTCRACGGKLRVTYQPMFGGKGEAVLIVNHYTCPLCRHKLQLDLPGMLVPPVQVRYD